MLHRPRISQRVLFTPRFPGKSYNPVSKSTHCKEKQIAVIYRWRVFTNNSLKKCFRNVCHSLYHHVSHIVGNLTSCVSRWHICGCPFLNQSSPVFQSGAFKTFETSGSLLLPFPTCLSNSEEAYIYKNQLSWWDKTNFLWKCTWTWKSEICYTFVLFCI